MFGLGRRKLTAHQMSVIVAEYYAGRLNAISSRPDTKYQLPIAFSGKVGEALAQHGEEDVAKLPSKVLLTLWGLHAAMFGDRSTLEEAVKPLSNSKRSELFQLYDAANQMRANEEQEKRDSEMRRIELGRNKIDLNRELDAMESNDHRSTRLLRWLESHGVDPDLWHEIATNTDPDGMDDVYFWIVSQTDCDWATAATIFHLNNSFEHLQNPEVAPADMYIVSRRIAHTVLERCEKNSFPTAKFSFDDMGYEEPRDVYLEEAESVRAAGLGPVPGIPESLFTFRSGAAPDTPYYYSDFTTFEQAFGPRSAA